MLKAAQMMDPGRFAAVAKGFEYRVNSEAALAEANRAYSRRYLHMSEPRDGLVHLEGLLDAQGGATLKTALSALMPPPKKDDDRTPGQRRADALVDLARRPLDGSRLGTTGGQRPHLIITASVDTLAGLPGAPPAQLEGVGPIPLETAQRLACDPTVSLLLGQAELESETGSHAHRRIPAATRRALVTRDRDCLQWLSPAGDLVRWAPPDLVDPRRDDGAAQPGTRLRPASSNAARRRLDAGTKERWPLAGKTARRAGSSQRPVGLTSAGLSLRRARGLG